MKKDGLRYSVLCIVFLFLGSLQTSQAQFFKKLKNKLSKKENSVKELYTSNANQTFNDWDQGASDIIAYIVSELDTSKRTHIIGNIEEDGSFTYKLPDSIATSVPISAYAEECTNAQEAIIKNPEVKMGLAKLLVGQNKEFIGAMKAFKTGEAAHNFGSSKGSDDEIGDTYLWVYADGEASIQLKCHKKFVMLNEKGQAYKDKMDSETNRNIQLKKGWNILRTQVTKNIPVGAESLHYTKNELSIVDALPEDIQWEYQPNNK